MDSLLHDALDRLLAAASPPGTVREIEAGGTPQALWRQIVDSGLADAMVEEARGGGGARLDDAFSLFALCGRHALPLPLAHTLAVRSLCARTGVEAPNGPIAIAPHPVASADGALLCRHVPYGRVAQWVVVYQDSPAAGAAARLLPVGVENCRDTGIHGSLQAHLRWSAPPSSGVVLAAPLPWLDIAAAITAAQMAGAMEAVLALTLRYAAERSQFGRPIGSFQAIQQQLAVLAELSMATRIAAELGCREAAPGVPDPLLAAAAKATAAEAAGTVASIAHAVHAAIGITEEYDLQLFTRRLLEWRTDYGAAGFWQRRLGDALLASSASSTLEFMLPALFPGAAPGPASDDSQPGDPT